jgi:hypothetical protein
MHRAAGADGHDEVVFGQSLHLPPGLTARLAADDDLLRS